MQTEIVAVLLSSTILFLLVNVQATVNTLTKGMGWIFGNREDQDVPEISKRTGRALANHVENVALFVPLALAVAITGTSDSISAAGAWIFVVARLVYVPLYVLGVRYARSLAWMVGVAGTAMVAWPLVNAWLG